MKRFLFFPVFCCLFFVSAAQLSPDSISSAEAQRIIGFLAHDSLKGRGNYTPQLHTAAQFIAQRFRQAGLTSFSFTKGYFQPFSHRKAIADTGGYNPEKILLNVIGVLEGKTKSNELVLFSSHYDHVGTERGKIHNGANDNASGTTALLLLADYYARRADNERTLVFCAFAGEELGLHGSELFANYLRPDSIVALVNMEMIGIPQVGKNALYITGGRYSDFEEMFKKALAGRYKIKREPAEYKELFQRSDNFPFARLGVPAHTIMTSDDDDKCYHQPCDDVERIDVENMTQIIRAIALGCEGLISGKDTPRRIRKQFEE
ncbi:MAG TPA: M28 family peptidase [Flavisolibacter sp.]|nr:M28 family peptidase [Flavisolibacter sp.]